MSSEAIFSWTRRFPESSRLPIVALTTVFESLLVSVSVPAIVSFCSVRELTSTVWEVPSRTFRSSLTWAEADGQTTTTRPTANSTFRSSMLSLQDKVRVISSILVSLGREQRFGLFHQVQRFLRGGRALVEMVPQFGNSPAGRITASQVHFGHGQEGSTLPGAVRRRGAALSVWPQIGEGLVAAPQPLNHPTPP